MLNTADVLYFEDGNVYRPVLTNETATMFFSQNIFYSVPGSSCTYNNVFIILFIRQILPVWKIILILIYTHKDYPNIENKAFVLI